MLEVSHSLMLIAITLAKGEHLAYKPAPTEHNSYTVFLSIYPERMLTVRSRIWTERNSVVAQSAFLLTILYVANSFALLFTDRTISTNSALVRTIIVAMIVVMIGTAIERIDMIDIVVTVPGHLPAVVIMKNVVPGLHPRRGIMMIEGLQGTMIPGEEAMMTADHLIIMMIVVGMNMTEDATTEDATTRKTATMIGQQDPRMVKDGVEDFVAEKRFTCAGKDGLRSDCFPFVYWTSPIVVVLPLFTGPRVIL